MTFYLGTHRPWWLRACPVPLFVSANTLASYRSTGDHWPAPLTGAPCWALDSGAFTALDSNNPAHPWHWHPDEYGGLVTRLLEDVGPADFVAPQDWPCEPNVLRRTGLTVHDHQELTLENYLYLREEFPFVPWLVPLQGWQPEDYLRHAEMYRSASVDLADAQRVGLGSVCRRSSRRDIAAVVQTLAGRGYRLHGFGVKVDGLRVIGHLLASADSLAWSLAARRNRDAIRLAECEKAGAHRGPCTSCMRWAVLWREKVLDALRGNRQLQLDLFAVRE